MKNEERLQLENLLSRLCNETITPDQVEQLNRILRGSAQLRQLYCDYLDVHVSLVDHARGSWVEEERHSTQSPGSQACGDTRDTGSYQMVPATVTDHSTIRDEQTDAIGLPTEDSSTGLATTSSAGVKRFRPLSLLLALTSLAATVFAVLMWLPLDNDRSTADSASDPPNQIAIDKPIAQKDASAIDATPLYLAQVTGVSDDVVWTKGFQAPEFLLRMRRGDRVDFTNGIVEIEYYSGAVLILHGPCAFSLTGKAAGRLERGRVTGRVADGDFVLTTPTARVIDLGTEFGVTVDSEFDTSVCVFDGKVDVESQPLDSSTNKTVSLTEGMSVKVDREGDIDAGHNVDVNDFTRVRPGDLIGSDGQLSLVDLFSAKSKSHYRLAGVIAPDTGEADQNPWLRDNGPGHRIASGFQVTAWHPFVDGVFIPTQSGQDTEVTSVGHAVDLPASTGRTWGPVWSRRKLSLPYGSGKKDDYWGTETLPGVLERLERCNVGLIGVHANVGVSFDLNAIRDLGVTPVRFRTIVENLDNSLMHSLKRLGSTEWAKSNRFDADFQVFVDGELRAGRIDFTREDGEMEMVVELQGQDRFLTLVSTDGGGKVAKDGFDHVVLIDPALELAE